MKVYFERSSWKDTICFSLGFSWEDWHIKECRLWFDLGIWSITINFSFKKERQNVAHL